MTGIEIAVFATIALACVGVAAITRTIGTAIGDALWKLNEWSDYRAYFLCGQAILDYEFDRGVDGLTAYKFAHKIMRGDA